MGAQPPTATPSGRSGFELWPVVISARACLDSWPVPSDRSSEAVFPATAPSGLRSAAPGPATLLNRVGASLSAGFVPCATDFSAERGSGADNHSNPAYALPNRIDTAKIYPSKARMILPFRIDFSSAAASAISSRRAHPQTGLRRWSLHSRFFFQIANAPFGFLARRHDFRHVGNPRFLAQFLQFSLLGFGDLGHVSAPVVSSGMTAKRSYCPRVPRCPILIAIPRSGALSARRQRRSQQRQPGQTTLSHIEGDRP